MKLEFIYTNGEVINGVLFHQCMYQFLAVVFQ